MKQTSEIGPAGSAATTSTSGERIETDRRRASRRRVGLVVWFLVLSLLSVSAVSIASALLLARYMTNGLLQLDLRLTTEFANHLFAFEGADAAFEGAPQKPVPAPVARFFTQVGQMPDILRANIYLLDGTVFWSTDRTIVGARFAANAELAAAAAGEPQAVIGRISEGAKDEHVNLGPPGTRFVENYLPMYRGGDARQPVVAVAEVYRTPQNLFATLQTGQRLVFLGAALGALMIVGTLVSLVTYADRLIRRQERAIADAERLATAGEMASAVAHGLRNPLAAIRSSAELALRLRTPERVVPLLDDIVLQSDRLEHWVRQYLTAAEPSSVERCDDIGPVVAAVRASLATELERQGIAWEEELDPALPTIAIGPALLEQLLSGVAANAIQAMPEGGTIRVSSAGMSAGMVVLRVTDTGIGMSRDQIERAFEPFVTSKQSGLGLGLALARRILSRHRGQIALDSQVGRGTVVLLMLPTAQ